MHQHLDTLKAKIRELKASYQVPGVAVGIVQNDGETIVCEGVTHIHHPLEITGNTLFQIASNTKTMTGVLVMQLVEAGQLELDVPVKAYLPELELADSSVAEQVTMRQLLNHTGGWVGDLFMDTGRGDDALRRYVSEVRTMPQITALGELWHYNNAAFAIAGRVIEVVSGQVFETVMHERLFAPLGMEHSSFFAEEAILHRHAVGHFLDAEERLQVARPWAFSRATGPVGGVCASVRDMMRYARMHLQGGKDVLSAESVTAMQQPTAKGQLEDKLGITWWLRELLDEAGNPVPMILHGGGAIGQMSAFWLIPSLSVACCILTNADGGSFLHRDLSAFIQRELLSLSSAEPVILANAELESFTGSFVGHAFGTRIELYVDHGQLMHKTSLGDVSSITSTPSADLPPARCAVCEKQRVLITEGKAKGSQLELLADSQGQLNWLRTGGRLYARER